MQVQRSYDIEDEVRKALLPYLTAYCRPYPAAASLPNVLITQVGGTDKDGQIDTSEVVLDARADNDATANETLRTALAVLRRVAAEGKTPLRHVVVNSSGAWGSDPVRPDLSMYSARVSVVSHLETITI